VVSGGSSWTAQIWSTRSLGDGQGTVRLLLWLGALVSAAIAYTGIILRRSNDMRIIDAEVRYAESKRMLRLDGLTGLQNRAGMHESIASALENKTTNPRRDFATVFLDLNDFKPVNDTYGHEVGDEVLRRTGSALRSALRAQDSIARIGGDEFVALCLNVSSSETADRLARDVHAAMSGIEIEVGGESIRIEASVGINITPQLDRPSVAEVLRRADAAMYDAKRSPGSQRTRITLGSQKARRNNANESVPERRVISSMVTERTPLRALDGQDIGEMIQPFLDEPAGARQIERVFRADASSALRQHTARWLADELAASRPTSDQWAQWVRLPRGGLDEILLRELATAWTPSEHLVLSFVVSETDLDKRISRRPKMVRMLGDMGISLVVEDYGLGTIPIPKFEPFPRVRTLLVSPEIVSEERPPSSLFHAVTDFAKKYGLHVAVNVSVDHSNGGTDGAYISMIVGTDSRHPAVLQD
ncbi:MAG: diguanylate cyclase domain-containing protein, partial [Acidimicrobiales bacterium]